MTKTLVIIMLLSSFGLVAQTYSDLLVPYNSIGRSKLLKVVESDEKVRAYVIFEESVNGKGLDVEKGEEVKINLLYVYDYFDYQPITVGVHVLDHPAFPPRNKYILNRGKKVYGTQEDVVTYDQLIELYEDLKSLKTLDTYNRLLPHEFYESKSQFTIA